MPWVLCRMIGEASSDTGSTTWSLEGQVEIAEEEREALLEALRIVEEDMEQEPRNLILANFQVLLGFKARLVQEYEGLIKVGETNPLRRLSSEVRGRLFIWLQSVRAYLDHTETRLKRRYGKTSTEAQRYRRVCSVMYDRYFAYRFLYRLRNAQHVAFAPIGVSLSESIGEGGREIVASVQFHRDQLLSGFDDWGSVKDELKQFGETFLMEEHLVTMMQCLDFIEHEVALIERPVIEAQVELINDFHSRVPSGSGSPVLIWLPGQEEPLTNSKYKPLPRASLSDLGSLPTIVGRPSGRGDDWELYSGEGDGIRRMNRLPIIRDSWRTSRLL